MTRVQRLGCIVALLVEASCSLLKPKPDPTQYFVLSGEERKQPAPPATKTLGVDRIELPEYLLRSEIVMRTESNQLKIAEYERWSESLKDGFSRTFRGNLEGRLGPGRVVTPPFDPSHRPPLVVDVDVHRFERVLPGGVVLEATWLLRDGATGTVLVTKTVSLREPVARDDTRAMVAALSTTLATLAGQIADVVRTRS